MIYPNTLQSFILRSGGEIFYHLPPALFPLRGRSVFQRGQLDLHILRGSFGNIVAICGRSARTNFDKCASRSWTSMGPHMLLLGRFSIPHKPILDILPLHGLGITFGIHFRERTNWNYFRALEQCAFPRARTNGTSSFHSLDEYQVYSRGPIYLTVCASLTMIPYATAWHGFKE